MQYHDTWKLQLKKLDKIELDLYSVYIVKTKLTFVYYLKSPKLGNALKMTKKFEVIYTYTWVNDHVSRINET